MIGFEVSRQFNNLGYEVHLFDLGEQIMRMKQFIPAGIKVFYGSILDSASLRAAMAGCEIVIHLGALLGVKRSESEKLRCLEVNIEGTKKVLECAVQEMVKKIVFASSSEVYGEPLKNPISEIDITQGKTVYAVSKLAGEELCKGYNQKYPLDFTILRYFNCYGPFQTAQFVLAKFIVNVMKGERPVVFGGGRQIRSYTYVSDTAKATILAALNDKSNSEIINIGNSREPISIFNLAKLIIKVGNKENILEPKVIPDFINSDRSKEREIVNRWCNADKAFQILGWKSEVSLEEGIKKVFENGRLFDRWENVYDESF